MSQLPSPNKGLVLNGILIFLLVSSPCQISEPYNIPFWEFSNGGKSKSKKQAGAELCQAQFKLGLALHALIGCKLAEI